ncbi:hypothetical protein BCV70DRAFT_199420 [Testicularia cyperi]|uniref:NAD(P)-binding domain-containing protein n=1 Tax=Testicularia cyperi TaxID=1882483 RepID=A0A317XTE7_9BASI|nr:hypothetical protein BCV70DRAFT_199420 [Testicularia cyperi]
MSDIATDTATSGKTAIILGSTGAVGKPLLAQLLADASYTAVYSFVRRNNPASLPPVGPGKEYKEILLDFDKLHAGDADEAAKLASVDPHTLFITLGTTRAQAGSFEAFEKIDRGYVLAAARAVGKRNAPTVVYCSSGMSASTSRFPYLKSKGLTEEGLASIFPTTIILRPGFLANANRENPRVLERISEPLFHALSYLNSNLLCPVHHVATGMIRAAALGPHSLVQSGFAHPPPASFRLENASPDSVAVVQNSQILQLLRRQS